MEASGRLWKLLEDYGSFWKSMEASGSLWEILKDYGNFQKIMEVYRRL